MVRFPKLLKLGALLTVIATASIALGQTEEPGESTIEGVERELEGGGEGEGGGDIEIPAVGEFPEVVSRPEDIEVYGPPSSETASSGSSSSITGGGAGSDSELSELCSSKGASADYLEILSGFGASMTRRVGSSTGCPNHVNWNINGNPAKKIPSNTSIPAYPILIADGRTTDLTRANGAVGIMLNGVSASISWSGSFAYLYESLSFYMEYYFIDVCGGHSTKEGWYYYHNTAGCLQEQAIVATRAIIIREENSPQLGWSYDGFPIYGQLGPGGVEMKVCGKEGADLTHCLDSCSGYEAELPDVDGFKYRYYTSCGFDESFFPFTTNCYRGCCPDGVTCGAYVEPCGEGSTEAGYTDGYFPEVEESLADVYDARLISGDDSYLIGSNKSIDCSLFRGSERGDEKPGPTGVPMPSTLAPSIWLAPSAVLTASPTASPSAVPPSDVPTPGTPGPTPAEDSGEDDGDTNGASGLAGSPTTTSSTTILLSATAVTVATVVLKTITALTT